MIEGKENKILFHLYSNQPFSVYLFIKEEFNYKFRLCHHVIFIHDTPVNARTSKQITHCLLLLVFCLWDKGNVG